MNTLLAGSDCCTAVRDWWHCFSPGWECFSPWRECFSPGWKCCSPGWDCCSPGWECFSPGWDYCSPGWKYFSPEWECFSPGWECWSPGWECFSPGWHFLTWVRVFLAWVRLLLTWVRVFLQCRPHSVPARAARVAVCHQTTVAAAGRELSRCRASVAPRTGARQTASAGCAGWPARRSQSDQSRWDAAACATTTSTKHRQQHMTQAAPLLQRKRCASRSQSWSRS